MGFLVCKFRGQRELYTWVPTIDIIPGMLRPRGPCGLDAKSFGLRLTLSGLDLGLMASGLIEIGLVASNIYSANDIN